MVLFPNWIALAVVLTVQFLISASQVSAADLEKGIQAWQAQDFNAALGELLPLAAAGNSTAQFFLGRMYFFGSGVQEDKFEASRLFQNAAEQGLADAQTTLGMMFYFGDGVQENTPEALRWFEIAAEQNDSLAQFHLGIIYEFGDNEIQKNEELAVQWFKAAAKQGYAPAQRKLGLMYERGAGVSEDDAIAAGWLKLAAARGDALARYNLGVLFLQGSGVSQNDGEAVYWFRLAAMQGDVQSQNNMGMLHYYGRGIGKSQFMAYVWLLMSEKNGYAQATRSRITVGENLSESEIIEGSRYADLCLNSGYSECDFPGSGQIEESEFNRIASQSKLAGYLSELYCEPVLLGRTQPIAELFGDEAVWSLVNVGPASAVVRTDSDPAFEDVVEPYMGGSIHIFLGDTRFRYTIGLVTPETEANIHVCAGLE